MATSTGYGLALKSDGTVLGWGSAAGLQLVPPGLDQVVQIAASETMAAALRDDGTIVGWSFGGALVPSELGSNNSSVAVSPGLTLALKTDGTVAAVGVNLTGQLDVPTGLDDVTAVAAGGYRGVSASPCGFGLALKGDGTVVGWGGANTIGFGCGDDFVHPAAPPAGLSDVIAISAGNNYSLALKSDGTVVAWGPRDPSEVQPPAGLTNVVAISAGTQGRILALKADGTVVEWGPSSQPGSLPSDLTNVTRINAGAGEQAAVLASSALGSPQLQIRTDSNPAGVAEAFQYRADRSVASDTVRLYLDATNGAKRLKVGIYSNTTAGNPGSLLAIAERDELQPGQWNDFAIPSLSLTEGRLYWIAVLAPAGSGRVRFRDLPDGHGSATQISAQRGLSTLPKTWKPGTDFANSPASIYLVPVG